MKTDRLPQSLDADLVGTLPIEGDDDAVAGTQRVDEFVERGGVVLLGQLVRSTPKLEINR